MANVFGVHSVGASIATFLTNAYPAELRSQFPAQVLLIASGQLADPEPDFDNVLTLLLYRVTVSEHLRNVRPADRADAAPSLALDLHYLLTSWAKVPMNEQILLAWAAGMLHQHPIFDASSLTPEAGWQRDEVIHVVPSELSTEDMMRVWDALAPSYRVSLSYTARVIRLDPTPGEPSGRVLAKRLVVEGSP